MFCRNRTNISVSREKKGVREALRIKSKIPNLHNPKDGVVVLPAETGLAT
jgi:hypothetical protein